MSSSDGPFYALRSEYARVLRALAAAEVLRSIYERAAELLRTDWTESALRGPRQRNADGGFSTAPAATRSPSCSVTSGPNMLLSSPRPRRLCLHDPTLSWSARRRRPGSSRPPLCFGIEYRTPRTGACAVRGT